MVLSPGGEEYRCHSSSLLTTRIIIKEEGSPASFSWVDLSTEKEIWAPILASRSLPIKGTGQLGRSPSWHCRGLQNGPWVWTPVAAMKVVSFPRKGPIYWVTIEFSVPVSTIKSIGWPPTLILIMGSWGPSWREPSPQYLDSAPASPVRLVLGGSGWYWFGGPAALVFFSGQLGQLFFQCSFSLE